MCRKGKGTVIYTIKIFKSWGARDPERRWSNTYEIESEAGDPSGLGDVVSSLVTAEKVLHHQLTNFLSATVSTWEPDGETYNPLTFTTIDLAGVGTRPGSAGDALDSNVCFVVRYLANLGRNGRRFYRGVLTEADVESAGDLRATLVTASLLQATAATFVGFKTAITPLLAGGAGSGKLVLAGANAAGVERPIVNVLPGGISVNKRNHRYFDRAS